MRTMKHLALAAAAASALALAGCGGGGSSATSQQQPVRTGPPAEQQPTPYETAKAAIDAATTAAAAQAAYNAVKGDVTAEQGDMLQAAVDARTEALAAMARAPVDNALAAIAAATTAAGAQAAYDAVKDDVTAAQGAELQDAVEERQAELATMARVEAQKMALMTAAGAVDTSDLSTVDAITAANTAIARFRAALAAAADVSDADKAMYQTQLDEAETAVGMARADLAAADRMMVQRSAIMDAVTMARDAVEMVGDDATEDQVTAADNAIARLQAAISGAADIPEGDDEVANAQGTLDTLEGQLTSAKESRMAAMEAERDRIDTANQTKALADAVAALEAIDLTDLSTQEKITAAQEAITDLESALAAATKLTDAEKRDATVDLTLAERNVANAQETLTKNISAQRKALAEAKTALDAINLGDLDTAEKIAAANQAVEALKMALAAATHLSGDAKAMYQSQLDTATETVRTAQTGMALNERMTAQRMAVTDAVTAATAAVGAVDDTATEDQVTAADNAIAALQKAIDDAVDLGEGDVASAQGALDSLMPVLASAKTSRTAAMEAAEKERRMAEAEEERKANEARAATAAKLHAGISAPSTVTNEMRSAAHVATAGTPAGASVGDIFVTIGDGTTDNDVPLSEDKKTMVADNHGWTGQRFAAEPDSDGTYEAVVYSKVPDPTEGAKFNAGPDDGGYTLNAAGATDPGELPITGAVAGATARIASSRFDQDAGTKEFERGSNLQRVEIPGSYHGVSGNYYCTPAASSTCAVQLAADGFTLGGTADADNAFTADGGTWTFKPTNPEARVMSTPSTNYASYGWWLHTAEDGDLTASAFAADRGTVDPAAGLTALRGSATYMGGAAGKYALSSSTGGTNDAGHFTARATLEADFNTDMVTGTIDNFMGVGGAKDWSVELMKSAIGDTGLIRVSDDDNTDLAADDAGAKTKWTIGGTAAAASGMWSGALKDNGDDGVPSMATGTFYTEYGNGGKMVGAFGANKQ